MRIIAGQRRGHKFDGPKGSDTRPTSDLVRESLFNILGGVGRRPVRRRPVRRHRGARARGAEPGCGAGDLHRAETRERGADLPQPRDAPIRGPCAGLTADAYRWARSFKPVDNEPLVVFLDPPTPSTRIARTRSIGCSRRWSGVCRLDSVIAAESRPEARREILPDLSAWDIRRYGGTQIAIRIPLPTEVPCPSRPRLAEPESRGGGPMTDREGPPRVRHGGGPPASRAGHQALWAGGCVRDLLLGPGPATTTWPPSATPEQVMSLFRPDNPGWRLRSAWSGCGARDDGGEVEVATFRSDGAYSTAATPSRSSSARPSSMPRGATSRSTGCSSIPRPTS